MKVGDLVSTGHFQDAQSIGVIIDSREVSATRRVDKGRNTHCHYVYWSMPSRTESNPVWIMERDLVKAV